jgi:cell division transport system permease protein
MQKLFRTINRSIKSGFVKFTRMYYISIPLTFFFALVITLCGLLAFVFGFSSHLTNTLNNRINVVVYFDRNASDALAQEISNKIKERPDVRRVDFVDSTRALQVFKERHAENSDTMQALSEIGTNPFGSSVVVYANDTRKYQQLVLEINNIADSYKNKDGISPVKDINYDDHKLAIERFASMLRKGEAALISLVFLLSAILFCVLYLALRLATQSDREEIKVMKLVGAPSLLMLGPSAIMGSLAGILGGLLSLFVLYFLAKQATLYTTAFDNFDVLYWYTNNINSFILYIFAFGIIAGFIGSLMAVKRHLK